MTAGWARRRRGTPLMGGVVASLLLAGAVSTGSPAAAATATFSNLRVTAVTPTTASIAWDTDLATDTQVAYGLTTAYGSTTALQTARVTSHLAALSGLTANRVYHYQARSRDAAGDLSVSPDRAFVTGLGASSPGAGTDSSNSGTINTTRFTTGVGGKVVALSVHVGAVDASVSRRSFQLGIYTASGTVPGTLVASSSTGTLVANSWNTVAINADLAPSTSYFFGYNTNGSSSSVNNMKYADGGISGWKTGGVAFGTWPASFGAFSAQTATFSIYASFAGDVTPPTVAVTQPVEGGTVSGAATLQANASDDGAVASVQFKVGGVAVGSPDTQAPYSATWDTTSLLNGPQTVTAVATDTAGLSTTSAPVTVTVANPARVRLTAPASGSSISGTSVTVQYVTSGDWVAGDGKHVHLRLDGGPTVMDFDADGNRSYTYANVPGGSHTIEAVVADSSHVEQPGSGGTTSFSTVAPDSSPPTVSLTAPAAGASLQGTVTVSATAGDDVAVVGVQFLRDGSPLGAEDTVAPYAVSWDTTTVANGSYTLTARARDSLNSTTSGGVAVTVANTDPRAVVGEWGPLTSWPLVAVHATLLHTGEILMWDAWELPSATAKLWNPATNTFTEVPVGAGLFCAGQATDAEGRLITAGGHDGGENGIKDVYAFDPVARAWTQLPDMRYDRWYPSLTQLPDGRMVTLSGQVTPGTFANTPEILTPSTGQVATLPFTTPGLREVQYPQTAVLPTGKLLVISAEQGGLYTFDPATSAWTQLGTTQVPYGAWTSFAPGKFLVTGGGLDFDEYNPGNPTPSQRRSRILDMTSGSPVWSDAGEMAHARSFHNVTMLPTGQALAIGGSTTVSDFSATGTVTAEVWSPDTRAWTQVASPARPRMYHSVSLLMPDGRVLSAGGGRLAPAPDQLNMQWYSPAYLFKGPRPTITSAPSTATHNSTMSLVSPVAADIASVKLVSLGSVTHTADWNQRFVDLSFTRSGTTLAVDLPSANVAPPNYYMVFAVNSQGVPSTAKIVKLGTPDQTAPTITDQQVSGLTQASASISWTTNEAADSRVEYGTTTAYGSTTVLDPAMSTSHLQTLTGLSAGTTYHFRVRSTDSAGNAAVGNDATFTTVAADAAAPTVTVTAPSSGATVSGTVPLTAHATDDVAVAGVRFTVDGVTVGSEDLTSPYAASWNSLTATNGPHTITAVARDAAGNVTTSSSVTVTVANATSTGLVAAYGFNEGTGTTFADGSGRGNHGTLGQATWAAAGRYGKALQFDGTNDYASVPDAPSLDLSTGMTLEAWVRPTASSGWRTVVLKDSGGVDLAYSLYSASGTNRPSGWVNLGGGSVSSVGTAAVPLNAWTHVATTFDGSRLKLYTNGVLRTDRAYTGTITTTAGVLTIGGNAVWSEFFAGQIDEVRIYDKALTVAQIQTDLNAPL